MITVDLSAHATADVRWAISPVLETLGWLRLTRDRSTDPTYGAPGRAATKLLTHPDVALVSQLLPSGDGPTPDFLVPVPPSAPAPEAASAQLEEIRSTDHARATAQVREASDGAAPPALVATAMDEGALPVRAAHGVAVFWAEAMPEVFELAEATLRMEIDRCTQLADGGGMSAALNAVHERLAQDHGTDELCDGCTELGSSESELLVIPTALYGHRVAMRLRGEHPFIAYPIGTPSAPPESIAGLRRLLGPTRAAILRHLSSARTTTELSKELRLAAATVSYHLKVMQRAGLLERSRRRHNVFYELSPTGRQLLSSLP